MKRSRHSTLYEEIADMKVCDCIQWDVPEGTGNTAMGTGIKRFARLNLPGVLVRSLFHGGRVFIVRIV